MQIAEQTVSFPHTTIRDALRESDHRIANHLSLLSSLIQLQVRQLNQGADMVRREDAQAQLREAAAKVLAIAGLHRRLSRGPGVDQIEIGNFLADTLRELTATLCAPGSVRLVQNLSLESHVGPETAHALGLFASEVLMNAVKYAHPAGVPLCLMLTCARNEEGQFTITLADDGVGLSETTESETARGVGFRLLRALAKGIDARLAIESDSLGLSFRLTLPETV